MTDRAAIQLFHGGHKGAESEFGRAAEKWGLTETTLSFQGHQMERAKNVRVLDDDELAKGQVSMEFVFQRMGRRFASGTGLRRVIQSMFQIVVHSNELFAVGWIQADRTVKGGTGWGVELAKVFNRKLHVYDQERDQWFTWKDHDWQADNPTIEARTFSATGTRNLSEAGRKAIHELFERTYGGATATEEAVKQSS